MKRKSNKREFREGDQWGCPRFSAHGAGWLVDWFTRSGNFEGASLAKGKDLEWIVDNPAEVARMQARVKIWRESLT